MNRERHASLQLVPGRGSSFRRFRVGAVRNSDSQVSFLFAYYSQRYQQAECQIRDILRERGLLLMIRVLTLMITAAVATTALFSAELSAHIRRTASGVQQESAASQDVPAYHTGAPKEPLPKTLNPDKFEDPMAKNAYAMAARIEEVLYQQPCYCHCDQTDHHASLLDCFVDSHGESCDICQREAIFAYGESKKGKSADEIRNEIMDGKYIQVNLDEYRTVIKLDK